MKDPSVDPGSRGGPPDGQDSTSSGLIRTAREHDPEAWRTLTADYGPMVYAWARKAGLSAEDAADVTQEVFRSVFTGLAGFRHDRASDTFRGWLLTVTRNKVRDAFRAKAHRPAAAGGSDALQLLLAQPDDASGSAGGVGPDPVVRRAVDAVRAEVEPRTWQAFWRTTVDGHSPADVARDLGMTANAVYVARFRVLRRLREAVGAAGPTGGGES